MNRRNGRRVIPPLPVYFDQTAGSDTNSGRSTGSPKQTISALNGLRLKPGSRLYLKRGETWTAATSITPAYNGIPGNPIRLGAYGSGARPIIKPTGLICQTTGAAGVSFWRFKSIDYESSGVHDYAMGGRYQNSEWDDCLAHGAPQVGFGLESEFIYRNITFKNCEAYLNGAWGGIQVFNSMAGADSNVYKVRVLNCNAHDNGGADTAAHHGIYLRGVIGGEITGNLCQDNVAGGIKLNSCTDMLVQRNNCYSNTMGIILGSMTGVGEKVCQRNRIVNNIANQNTEASISILQDCQNNEFYHNTIAALTQPGCWIEGSGSTGNIFKNNIFFVNDGLYLRLYDATCRDGNTFDYNVVWIDQRAANETHVYVDDPGTAHTWTAWVALPKDANSIRGDPLFATEFTNLHIQTNSPAKNAGQTGLGILVDYDQVLRDATPDIGAYEYV